MFWKTLGIISHLWGHVITAIFCSAFESESQPHAKNRGYIETKNFKVKILHVAMRLAIVVGPKFLRNSQATRRNLKYWQTNTLPYQKWRKIGINGPKLSKFFCKNQRNQSFTDYVFAPSKFDWIRTGHEKA